MILHTVAFTLKHATGSDKEAAFLKAADVLAAIPSVGKFEKFKQVSPKNGFAFGFSFEFADQAAYDAYNVHPDHVAFVRDRWVPEVADFLETDYAPLTAGRKPIPRPRPGGGAATAIKDRLPKR